MKKKLNLVIKILVSIVLFWIIFRSIDLKILIGNFSNFQPIYAVLIVLCLVLNYVVSSIRWKGLLIHEGGNKVSVWYLTRLYFVGSFFNNFLPTSIGGDVYKIFCSYLYGTVYRSYKSHANFPCESVEVPILLVGGSNNRLLTLICFGSVCTQIFINQTQYF